MTVALCFLLAVSTAAAPRIAAPAKTSEFTVMPGHSLGKVWINAPHSVVRRLWGHPYLIRRQGRYTIEFWRVSRKDINTYKAATFRHNRVIQLETNSPRFVTPHGISVRSNLGYIRRVLGRMRTTSVGLNHPDPDVAEHASHYYDSVRRGIAFDLGLGFRPNLSPATTPYKLSAATTPYVLYVHRRGYRLLTVHGDEVWAEDSPKSLRPR